MIKDKQKIYIDCGRAVKDSVSKEDIIKTVEKFYGYSYWQAWQKWDINFRYLYLQMHTLVRVSAYESITKSNMERDGFVIVDWYDLNKDKNLRGLFKDTKFNEGLL